MVVLEIFYWLAAGALVHSYLLYPLLLSLAARGKSLSPDCYTPTDAQLPKVSILMAVYNEELVLEEKLESLLQTDYPLDKISILIGSDNSTDDSHSIIERYQAQYPQIHLEVYEGRNGKPNILNQLQPLAQGDIYIFTDANVIFDRQTIFHLVKHFKRPDVGQVGANFLNKNLRKEGISHQEKAYIQRETLVKYHEGVLWGCMMGAFGGCYALRADLFVPNPPNFIVEDFYLSMKVLAADKKALLELEAIVYEDVPNAVKDEFRRKARISAGNFQNLAVFKHLLWPPYKGLAFSFLSHKVLRWLGPLLLLLCFACSFALAFEQRLYLYLFLLQLVSMSSPFWDYILKRINVHWGPLRFVAYFYAMNLALLVGLVKYIKGIQSNVWQPTKRKA